MKICNHISLDHIFLNRALANKDSVLRFIADTLQKEGIINDAEHLYDGLLDREQTMSTGIGNGIGLPHTTNGEVRDPIVLLIRPESPIPFNAIDNLPVDIIIALIIPEGKTSLHIQILAGVSRLCKNPDFLKTIREFGDPMVLHEKINSLESRMAFH